MLNAPYNKTKTVVYTALITFVFTILLFYGGCVGLTRFFAMKTGCEGFNIDNYEVRTFTNISNTKDQICTYDKASRTKSTIFLLDLTEKEISRNIEWNNLKKVTECTLPIFRHNPHWNDSIGKLPQEQLYSKSGSNKEDSWIYVLDSTNQTLWAELTEDVNYKE